MNTSSVNFPDDVEKICSPFTLQPAVVRILGDALPGFDEVVTVPVAIEHDPLTIRQSLKIVFRNLLGDDEVPGTRALHHATFQLDEAAE
jgi:hypothetical protein